MAERALGDVALGRELWEEALAHYERAVELDPMACCYLVRVGIARARLGDRDGAEAAWAWRERRDTLDCSCAMIRVFADLLRKELPG